MTRTAAHRDVSPLCAAGVDDEHVKCMNSKWYAGKCGCYCHDPSPVTLESFGYGHPLGAPADADVVIDVRARFRDPHVDPRLRQLDGYDDDVRDAVMATAGVPELVDAIVALAAALRAAPAAGPIKIAVGCVGGRHRSVVIVNEAWERLWAASWAVGGHHATGRTHRDIDKPVIRRPRAKTA